jgi:hypothetical protein
LIGEQKLITLNNLPKVTQQVGVEISTSVCPSPGYVLLCCKAEEKESILKTT